MSDIRLAVLALGALALLDAVVLTMRWRHSSQTAGGVLGASVHLSTVLGAGVILIVAALLRGVPPLALALPLMFLGFTDAIVGILARRRQDNMKPGR